MTFAKALAFAWAIAATSSGDGRIADIPDPEAVQAPPVQQVGRATWYGAGTKFHGDWTASGQRFRPDEEVTCAHRTLPFGTVVMLEDPETGRRIWCRINDRGPYVVRTDAGEIDPVLAGPARGARDWTRIADLSRLAAWRLGVHGEGLFDLRIRYWTPVDAPPLDLRTAFAHPIPETTEG